MGLIKTWCTLTGLLVSAAVALTALTVERTYSSVPCTSDQPYSTAKKRSRMECALTCLRQPGCKDHNFDVTTNNCSIFINKPLFFDDRPGCYGYEDDDDVTCVNLDAAITIPSRCCAIPFTLNGAVHYNCTDDGGGLGCFYGNRVWKLCQLPAEFEAVYTATSTTALSANPAVYVPLMTVNRWLMMQRMVTGGSTSFSFSWAGYRDGFGSAAGNDNYWLGLDKVYRLMQQGNVGLRVEVQRTDGLWYSAEYTTFSISDEASKYQLTVAGYSGDAGDAMAGSAIGPWNANGQMFSTPDSDNDAWGGGVCAGSQHGWWFGWCSTSCLTRYTSPGYWWADPAPTNDVQTSRMLFKLA